MEGNWTWSDVATRRGETAQRDEQVDVHQLRQEVDLRVWKPEAPTCEHERVRDEPVPGSDLKPCEQHARVRDERLQPTGEREREREREREAEDTPRGTDCWH